MNRFEYINPKNLKEASRLLDENRGDAILYSGGTDALDLLKNEVVKADKLINLKAVRGLNRIEYRPGYGLSIGACALVADIAEHPAVAEKYTILAEAAEVVASPQLRNMGTVGGNICQRPRCWYFRGDFHCLRKGGELCYAVDGENRLHCIIGGGPCYIVHPSDIAVALTALDARLTVYAHGKSRDIPIGEFFVLPEEDELHENILKPGEIITRIYVPDISPGTRSGYSKFRERAVWDFAVVSVGTVQHGDGRVSAAFGGVAPVPWTDYELNEGLSDKETRAHAIQNAFRDAEPMEKNGYKVSLVRTLLERQLNRLNG
ncbi:MAG: xanthine dehydrogenase family protein subunit M [candidate division KSB1 bacterium]|jgi:xanthine dehydrogenase YagS FAD-binding subunit|nr:xanthine dehydrogenase family protein subunit M [candidate division KSB1 bacterium]